MWHFCLAVDLLHLCAERGFDTSRGSYVLLKGPPGRERGQQESHRPGPLSSCIFTAWHLGRGFSGVAHSAVAGEGPHPPGWLVCPWLSYGASLSLNCLICEMDVALIQGLGRKR